MGGYPISNDECLKNGMFSISLSNGCKYDLIDIGQGSK
jgi:hypothetical protein